MSIYYLGSVPQLVNCHGPNLKFLIMPKLYLFPIDKFIPRQYLTFTQHSFNISLSKCDLNLKYFYPLAPTAWWKDDGGREQRG